MEYIEFLEAVETGLRTRLGETIQIDAQELLKNNVRREVMVIRVGQERATPCIPIESLYAMYQLGEPLEEIIDKVVAIVQDNSNIKEIEINRIQEWDYVKELVEARIIGTENNKEFLADLPHREFLDCSIIYYLNVNSWVVGEYQASMKITNQNMNMWGVTEEELDQCARANYLKKEIRFQSMQEVLAELLGNEAEAGLEDGNKPMYVLSNKERQYGAVVVRDEETLQSVYKKLKGDYYILPSSVHELILVPSIIEMDAKELKEMVVSINDADVSADEVLSNSVYYYDGEKVSVVA